jgi:TonB-dependent receptor
VVTTVADDFGSDSADVSKPVNAGGGQVAGFEVNGIYNFGDDWTPWLKGFGVSANYTYSDSTSDQVTSFTSHLPIPGVSKDSVTATGFYERAGFSARLSYTWRSAAVNDGLGGATFQFPDQNGVEKTYGIYQAPYGQLDGQVSYDFNPHVGLVFSVQNITDSAQHTYLQWPDQPFTYDNWGRRYFFGIKFKG